MDLGTKLKQARQSQNMTQEALAQRLGVSRQTVSNWENNRFYPDIVSIVAISDCYGLSLDALLKGDQKMMEHLEQQTNTVKSRRQLSKAVLLASYLTIWAGAALVFWLGGRRDALGYSIAAFYLTLPLAALICGVFIGKDEGWEGWRWPMVLFFGLMQALAPYATFTLANLTAFEKFHLPQLSDALPGVLGAFLGVVLGSAIWAAEERRRRKANQSHREKE